MPRPVFRREYGVSVPFGRPARDHWNARVCLGSKLRRCSWSIRVAMVLQVPGVVFWGKSRTEVSRRRHTQHAWKRKLCPAMNDAGRYPAMASQGQSQMMGQVLQTFPNGPGGCSLDRIELVATSRLRRGYE